MNQRYMQIVKWAEERYKLLQDPFEIHEAMHFLDNRGLNNFLEIGTYGGGTFACWASIIPGIKISLDMPPPDINADERDAKMREDFAGVHILRGDSHNYAHVETIRRILGDEKVDFLFIDGDHSQRGCKQDYDMYVQFVNPQGGIIGFHDIVDSPRHRSEGCFVGPAFQSIGGPRVEILGGNVWGGIGFIMLGEFGQNPYIQY